MNAHDIFPTKKSAAAFAGSLGKPSKMPGKTWGISAHLCNVGSVLQTVEGSTCSDCYALKGQYQFSNVKAAHAKRLAAFNLDPERWAAAMVVLITGEAHFRWLDSGDLQSPEMALYIMLVCDATPDTEHWLPTRERHAITQALLTRDCPPNLTIRLSDTMVDQERFAWSGWLAQKGVVTSGVTTGEPTCPAPEQNNECADCRACWDRDTVRVTYKLH